MRRTRKRSSNKKRGTFRCYFSNMDSSNSVVSENFSIDTSPGQTNPTNVMCYTIDSSVSKESDVNLSSPTILENISDTESDSSVEVIEHKCCIDLTELDDTVETLDGSDCSVITLHDSTHVPVKSPTDHFRLDTAPDFIPVDKVCGKDAKRKQLQKKRKVANVPNDGEFSNPLKKQRLRSGVQPIPPPMRWVHPPIIHQNFFPHPPMNNQIFVPRRQVLPSSNGHIFGKNPTPLIQLSYPNIFNENAGAPPRVGLRPIIIDGANVGFEYGNQKDFVMHGLILVIQYFKNRGHDEIVCFLPKSYRHRVRSPSEERTLCNLESENIFSYTPTRQLENGQKYTPYDDRFILQYATERQGVIISNDGYRDLINEEPSWRETIERRIVNFTFARDIFMLPKDPHGPSGPTLDEILKFPEM